MLPCVCSVIDHRWRQNVVRTKKWHTRRSRVCHWCSYHILTSSVIYYWIRHTATWNLFVLYNKEKPFLFQNISTSREHRPFAPPFPAFARKKPFDVIYLFKMKQFHWLLCAAKNCDWSRKIAPLSDSSAANLQRKQNWTAKSTNLEENAGKIKSVFVIGVALWAEKLGRCLKNYRSWKNTLGKLVVVVNLEAIWFEFWMKGWA